MTDSSSRSKAHRGGRVVDRSFVDHEDCTVIAAGYSMPVDDPVYLVTADTRIESEASSLASHLRVVVVRDTVLANLARLGGK